MKHESARGGLQFASGIVVASSDFLTIHLQIAAVWYWALIFSVILKVSIVIARIISCTAKRLAHIHWN